MLNWYKQLIQLRRDNPALHSGKLTMLNTDGHERAFVDPAGTGRAGSGGGLQLYRGAAASSASIYRNRASAADRRKR